MAVHSSRKSMQGIKSKFDMPVLIIYTSETMAKLGTFRAQVRDT